jgi:hypothetical protein
MSTNGRGELGDVLRALKEETGLSLAELSVLAPQNDPFRLDTPANHALGKWFHKQMKAAGYFESDGVAIHLRGLHYIFVTKRVQRPDGKPYRNDDANWTWLVGKASKAARWLGYVPFDRIIDERNGEPVVRSAPPERCEPLRYVSLAAASEIPDLTDHDLSPAAWLDELESPQAYRLALFGEKTSLEPVLDPLADEYGADLYLAAGEQTDTRIYTLARHADEDGRELVVFVFADCDPAGWQMAISIGHNLRAFKENLFPDLRFRLHAPALTVEQVRELELPSTPLKETEKRASSWREAFGIEQTEIDALASLNPATLAAIARQAIAPYFDETLARRLREAEEAWRQEAQDQVDAAAEANPEYAELRESTEDTFAEANEALDASREALAALQHATDGLVRRRDLPAFDLPEAEPSEDSPAPLVSSDMPLEEHIARLRERKRYTNGEDA